jgi:hypothetical protein
MLISSKLAPIAKEVVFGDLSALEAVLWEKALNSIDPKDYSEERVVIKGCGDLPVTAAAYSLITLKLTPVVKSIMYGEPCSTVPIYKAK